MRYTYILSAFIAGAMAVPGAYIPRAEANSSPSTTTDISSDASTTTISAPNQSGTVEIPSEWDKVDLDKWIRLIANETINESNSKKNLTEKEEHLDVALGIMECYFDISDAAACEKNVIKPFAYYTRVGVYYSREWYKKIYNKYYAQAKQWKAKAESFAEHFTHHKMSCGDNCNYFKIAKKAIKHWKSIFSGSSSMLGGFDLSSAGLSFASGVVAATKSNVTELVKKELSQPENIKDAFLNVAGLLKNASMTGFAASAVNVAWTVDNVFIAKASDKIGDQRPADMDLSILDNKARTCEDDGTCYFFIVAQNISNLSDKKWKGVKGINMTEEYNVDLLQVAKSATWFQKQFDGYAAKPNATALLKSLQGNETMPSLSYFVNLPVVNYDGASSSSSSGSSSEETFLKGLTRQVSKLGSDWPYVKSS